MKKAIIVLSRVPVPGKTKTRLMPALSPEQCSELHTAMLKDLLRTCERTGVDTFLFFTPEKGEERLAVVMEGLKAEVFPQRGRDLGERMRNAIKVVLDMGYDGCVLVGCDIPGIEQKHFTWAFDNLAEHDVVLAPTLDGGYYMIGMKAEHEGIWDVPGYGTASICEQTTGQIHAAGLSLETGECLPDIDRIEDIQLIIRTNGKTGAATREWLGRHPALQTMQCIHCGKCKENCLFLKKYDIDLQEYGMRPELAYHCFLCGRCREVCPYAIDGRQVSLEHRRKRVECDQGKLTEKAYKGLMAEKNPYKFRNYRKGGSKTALFPGCNFTSFYPQTEKKLLRLLNPYGIGVIRDCCSKPVYELGLVEDAERNLKVMQEKLQSRGIEELVMVCPNCYYFMKARLDMRVVTVYEKLAEFSIGNKIPGNPAMHYPCPDRAEQDVMKGIRFFMEETEVQTYPKLQCCGLGGCAAVKEPEISEYMGRFPAGGEQEMLYTYCASCISQFRRKGSRDTRHVLEEILDVHEEVPLGIKPFMNRAGKII